MNEKQLKSIKKIVNVLTRNGGKNDNINDMYLKYNNLIVKQKEYFNTKSGDEILKMFLLSYSYYKTSRLDLGYEMINNSFKISCMSTELEEVYVECDECAGNGEVGCDECDSRGDVRCDECDGDGEIVCEDCDGDGCEECDESGYTICEKCDGNGEISCGECGGEGFITCYKCDGNGDIESEEYRNYIIYQILTIDQNLYNLCEMYEDTLNPISEESEFYEKINKNDNTLIVNILNLYGSPKFDEIATGKVYCSEIFRQNSEIYKTKNNKPIFEIPETYFEYAGEFF